MRGIHRVPRIGIWDPAMAIAGQAPPLTRHPGQGPKACRAGTSMTWGAGARDDKKTPADRARADQRSGRCSSFGKRARATACS